MPDIGGDLKGVEEITACASRTTDLYFDLDQVNFGFGINTILDKFEKWRETCKIRSDDVFVPKKLIKDAIRDYKEGKHDLVKGQLETAQKQIMREALIKISRAK